MAPGCVWVGLLVCGRLDGKHPGTSTALNSSLVNSSLWGSWHQDCDSETGGGHGGIMPRWETLQTLQSEAKK